MWAEKVNSYSVGEKIQGELGGDSFGFIPGFSGGSAAVGEPHFILLLSESWAFQPSCSGAFSRPRPPPAGVSCPLAALEGLWGTLGPPGDQGAGGMSGGLGRAH